jgi:hypothetical protein
MEVEAARGVVVWERRQLEVLVVEAAWACVVRHLAASRGKRIRGACFLARSGQLECSTT